MTGYLSYYEPRAAQRLRSAAMQRISSLRLALGFALATLVAACTTATSPSASSAAPTGSGVNEVSPSASPSVKPAGSESARADPLASPDTNPAGFSVLPNPDADALFVDRDECENLEDGYRLQFPEDWYTNTEIGDVPACSWFSPTFFEVRHPDEVPAEIAITVEYMEGDFGAIDEVVSHEEVVVGGTQVASRAEWRGAEGEGGMHPADWMMYAYQVQLGPTPEEGPNLVVLTTTESGGDYELNKAVLDRIMATIEFLGTIQ